MKQVQVNVVGLGYIGLPTALMMAAHGVEVVGTDFKATLVDTLTHGQVTFKEDGLETLYASAVQRGIQFSTAYQKAEIYVVSVPTPYDKVSKKIDASYVMHAVQNVLDVCEQGAVIVVESTIAPGTIDRYIRPLVIERGLRPGVDVHLAHAPERIIPGNMLSELLHNSRTIGADDPAIGEKVRRIYQSFCQGDIEITDIRTAEMTKVVENTYRDINIAFANELLKICRSDGLDVNEIIRISNKHPRVNILSPGPGVGGHCISVDPWFLVGDYPALARLIRLSRETNDGMPAYVLSRVAALMGQLGLHNYARVGFYGLTYKENVDDMRESPTLQLIEKMHDNLAPTPKTYDPMISFDVVDGQYHSFEAFLQDIDVMVVMVHHAHLDENIGLVQNKAVFDTRNCHLNWDASNKLFEL
ncbi:MAG: nucleotide sugar dehydrogenase [Oscillospiraceae bacterium]|nr:nucleotide sugar dehydrogenase [Oscillospiraceae bacterium]